MRNIHALGGCATRGAVATAIVLALSAAATSAHASDRKAFDTASDVGQDVLIAAALGVPALRRDWTGEFEAAASLGAAFGVSEGLKSVISERRPDRSDNKSFPSGHASASFAAAATLQRRYGWEIGVPAQVLAAFVAASRVEARKHYWYDVVAGAAIGEASGFLLTRKHDSAVRILPWGDAHGGGVALSLQY